MKASLFLYWIGTLMEEIYLCYLNLSNILTACQIIENVGNRYKGLICPLQYILIRLVNPEIRKPAWTF